MSFSIVIPTYNGENTIQSLLEKISEFTVAPEEIIVIDSQSEDRTVKIVERFGTVLPIKITGIHRTKFNHGTTRNKGAGLAKGKYVYFLSQDAVPVDKNILKYYAEDFRTNKKTVAVFGKHVPFENTPAFQKAEIICRWERLDSLLDDKGLLVQGQNVLLGDPVKQDPYDQYALSNTSCCYRRDFLLAHPFKKVNYGEDLMMGKEIIDAGYVKIYDPRCAVYHSHFFNVFQYLRREEKNQRLRVFTMGLRTKAYFWCKLKKILRMDAGFPVKFGYLVELGFYYFLKIIVYGRLRLMNVFGSGSR